MLWSQRIHRSKQGRDELGALQELTVKTWPGFVDWDTGVECRVSGEQMWAWLDLLQLQTEVCQRWTRAPAVARSSLGVCSPLVVSSWPGLLFAIWFQQPQNRLERRKDFFWEAGDLVGFDIGVILLISKHSRVVMEGLHQPSSGTRHCFVISVRMRVSVQ